MIPPVVIQLLLVAMSFVMIGVAVIALYSGTKAMYDWKRRIRSANRSPVSDTFLEPLAAQQRLRWQQRLNTLGNVVKPRQQRELSLVRRRLLQAGYRHPIAVSIYYLIKYGLLLLIPATIALILWGTLWQTSDALPALDLFIYIFAMAAMGYFAPNIWLRLKIRRRKEQIGRAFPDALDLLVLCIESGLGIDAAMQRSAQDIRLTYPLLSQELRLVTDGIRAGQPRQVAFDALNQRVDLEDIHNFTSLISQTERLGVSITQSIRKISESMRVKRRNDAERFAAQLPVKLIFPVVLFIFPGIFVIIMLPAVIEMYRALSPIAN